ncbi:MAG: hypothetical protein ACXACU_18495 [Candidatus Hodarchaeales archaeon]
MNDIQLKDDFYEWTGSSEILKSSYFKVSPETKAKIIGVESDISNEGVIIIGNVKAIIDSLIFTKSHGAVGNTISFSGTNLVILGLSIADLHEFLTKIELSEQNYSSLKEKAESMISKFNRTLSSPKTSINMDQNEDEMQYIIFGKRNFLLITSENKFVLIHNKQISIRKGEHKLVQIDPHEGILIAEKNKVFNIGGSLTKGRSILGEFGVNIANSVLENILWD